MTHADIRAIIAEAQRLIAANRAECAKVAAAYGIQQSK